MTAEPPSLPPLSIRGLRRFRDAVGQPPFRGTMIDNCAGAPMGKGHKNDGQPFDIETACYLKPLVEAYHRPGVRKIVIKAGVKTLKSFFVELAAAHYLCHSIGDVTIYFGTGEMADDQSTTRILNYFEGIESYREKLKTIIGQWDATMSAIKFPDKTFRIKPANLGNTQGVNLGFMGVCDAFVTEASGMIDQAIERTTQYADDKKIVIESQGGETGFDFDRHYDDTDQGELAVICPLCASQHIFNWKVFDEISMKRPDDFIPKPPMTIPSLDHAAWIAHHQPLLKGKVAGFQRGDEAIIKFKTGEYNEAEILRQTHFQCYHCGGIWRDDGEFGTTRIALDKSSFYIPARLDALPENVGFNFPQWINRRLPWGKIMLEKLKRHKVANELGNVEPLKQWWQKFAGRTWDSEFMRGRSTERPGASIYEIDPVKKMPGELARISGTDIQFKLTHMVYLAVAVGDGTPPWVLHAEWVKPPAGLTDHAAAEHCKARVRELDKKFGIQPQNSMKDAAHEPGLVRDWAAEDATWGRLSLRERPHWIAFGLLLGDDRMSYKWVHPGRKDTWERFKQYQWHKVDAIKDGRRCKVDVHHRLWSNPSIKEIAERWRDGLGAPKLQIHYQFLRSASGGNPKEGLWEQLTSERKIPWKGHPGKLHYNNEGRPNHFWDCWCMIVVRMDELGYLNSFGAPPEDAEATD